MNKLKKFNKFLIENHPLLFQSKFFQLLLAGLGVWLISFISGYIFTTQYSILHQQIESQYINSSYVGFHIILFIIVASLWVFNFFQLNPIKNYYPITKHYFTKLFLLLLLPFIFLVSAYIPYTSGAILKTSQLIDEKDFKKDAEALNLGATFFVSSLNNYGIDNKAYPLPFPTNFFKFDKNLRIWKDGSSKIYSRNGISKGTIHFHPDVNMVEYLKPEDSIYNLEKYLNSSPHSEIINREKYIFYSSRVKYHTQDSCLSNEFINEIFDVSNIKNLTQVSLYNYSEDMVDIAYLKPFPYKYVHGLMDKKDMKSIALIMDDFKNVLKKYKVENSIKTKQILTYLKQKEFNDLNINFILETKPSTYYRYNSADTKVEVVKSHINLDFANSMNLEEYLKGKTPLEQNIILEKNYYSDNQLYKLTENYKRVYQSPTKLFDMSFIYYMFGAGFFVLLFIWFVFMDIRTWLISIPVAGVVFIIITLIFVSFDKFNILDNDYFGILALLIMYLILFLNIKFIKSLTKSKMISSILMNISYVISVLILPFTIFIINDETKYKTQIIDKCGKVDIQYNEIFPFADNPLIIFVLSFIGIIMFFSNIKKWKSKRE